MKKILALALVAGAVSAPVALSHGDEHGSSTRVRMVEYVFKGVVVKSTPTSVDIDRARGLTRFARRSLDGATTFTVKLDGNTRMRGRHGARGPQVRLSAGDRVEILIRAPRGMAAADLPAARYIFDRSPAEGTATPPPPAPEPVVTTPAPTPGPAAPPGGGGSPDLFN